MGRISQRVAGIEESATLAITAKAKAMIRQGIDVVEFGAGEPDFDTPAHIVEAAVDACRDPVMHKYTPVGGLPELRAAVAAKTKRDSGYDVTADNVLITNGGKQAILHACASVLNPGDEVLLPSPFWLTYPESIRLGGGVPVIVETDEASGFRASVAQLEAACGPKTKMLVFNSPSNPTGAVYTREEIAAIGDWVSRKGIWVICDEIYEHLVYGGAEQHSMPVVVPALQDRCLVVNGVAKTYAMTGWRVGWIVGPADIVKAATNLHSHSCANVANVSQRATLAAVSGPLDDVMAWRESFDRRRRTIVQGLNEIDGVSCVEPHGAFYAFPSVRGVLGREIAGKRIDSSFDLAQLLLEEAKVALTPGEAFGAPGYLRISYVTSDQQVEDGVARIAKLLA